MAKGRRCIAAPIAMIQFADKLIDRQTIDRVESVVLLSLIGGGLAVCVVGAAVYDVGRALSVW
jgi:hypothetical protein